MYWHAVDVRHLSEWVERHDAGDVLDVAVQRLNAGALNQNIRLTLDVTTSAAHHQPTYSIIATFQLFTLSMGKLVRSTRDAALLLAWKLSPVVFCNVSER